MCRNITVLRGLEPAATPEEIEAAARQYVRKVSGVPTVNDGTREAFEAAVAEVAASTARLLAYAARPASAADHGPAAPPPVGAGADRRRGEGRGGSSCGRRDRPT